MYSALVEAFLHLTVTYILLLLALAYIFNAFSMVRCSLAGGTNKPWLGSSRGIFARLSRLAKRFTQQQRVDGKVSPGGGSEARGLEGKL
jgi:hypothetical protein